jgi:hypothetical protein
MSRCGLMPSRSRARKGVVLFVHRLTTAATCV